MINKNQFLLTAVICLLSLTGCNPSERPIDKANKEGILLVGNHSEPSSIDPQRASGVNEMRVALALFEGLVRLNPQTLAAEPAIAESWEVSADGKNYIFYLRDNARFSDGAPILASDFVETYKRLLSPQSLSPHVNLFAPILNAKAYQEGEIDDFSEVGIKALTPYELEITLQEPTPYFLSLLAYSAFAVLNTKAIKNHPEDWTLPAHFIGSGPFTLENWKINDVIAVKRNPHYWDNAHVALNGIRFFPIEDQQTEGKAFLAGQLHITASVEAHRIEHCLKTQDACLYHHPYLSTDFYAFNTKHPPLDDVRVRRALALAIDRKAITKAILRQNQLPAYGLTPPGVTNYPSKAFFEEDIALAQDLLAEAGFPQGKGFPKLTLFNNNSSERMLIAQAIQGMWQQNLSIHVELESQEWKSFLANRRCGNFDICRASWVGDYNDPTAFLELYRSDNPFNCGKWSNKDYDALLDKAITLQDPMERSKVLAQAEALLMDEMPCLPIYFLNWNALVQPCVKGYYTNVMDYHPYTRIRLEKIEEK